MGSCDDSDVIIAGGGPVGLLLACELRLAEVGVVVLERTPDGADEPRQVGLHSRTLEMLDRRGLRERFEAAQPDLSELAEFRSGLADGRARGHFAGLFALGRFPVATDQPGALFSTREIVQQILTERARTLGATLRYGHTVTELSQDDEGVTVVTDTSEGPVTLRGSYLVGCGGGRSIVRKNSGIDFVGTGPTTISRMGFATATAAHTIRFGFHRMERGWLMRFPGNRWIVIEWDVPEDLSTPMTVDELNEAILRVSGQDLGLSNPVFVTRFTDNARQADRYCVGRVLLAGDAAHVHSPAGGQGLNLGLQDAFNLGWKLAATLHGWAPPHLLDTYHAERHPIAAEVLANTRAQLALMRPGPHVDALREIFARILEMEEPNRYITEMVTGNDVRYARPGGAHPLVGGFARDMALETGAGRAHLVELLRSGGRSCSTSAIRPRYVPRPSRGTTASSWSPPWPPRAVATLTALPRPRRCWSDPTASSPGPAPGRSTPAPCAQHWPAGSVRQSAPRPSDPASMGFNDASHFSKTFKRAFGVTPTSIMPTARR